MFFSGIVGMLWASWKGMSHRGINEELFYGLFTVCFFLVCVIAPIILFLGLLLWTWGNY